MTFRDTMKAANDVLEKRLERIERGAAVECDDSMGGGGIIGIAASYLNHAKQGGVDYRRSRLVMAGALILSEIERLDRMEAKR